MDEQTEVPSEIVDYSRLVNEVGFDFNLPYQAPRVDLLFAASTPTSSSTLERKKSLKGQIDT